jgi:hypothetical protein
VIVPITCNYKSISLSARLKSYNNSDIYSETGKYYFGCYNVASCKPISFIYKPRADPGYFVGGSPDVYGVDPASPALIIWLFFLSQ